jgi:hypothetical protein
MRTALPILWMLLGLPAFAAPPKIGVAPSFQMFPDDLRAAAGIMDEALKDVWHAEYLKMVESQKKFTPREPVPAEQPPPPEVSDEIFIRRATLDATDVIPTAEEVRAFLADPAPDRRERLVDHLLLSPAHAQRQFNRYADMLRLRDKVGGIPQAGYIALVRAAAEENLPFDQFVESLLTASGNVPDNPACGFLLRDQGNLLQTVDELEWSFLHENVHCAVCHDHPFNDTTQYQFYELASCFGATQVVLRELNQNVITEKEVWPQDAYRALADSKPRDGLLTIRDTPAFGLRVPGNYKYRDAKPNQLVKKAIPLPIGRAINERPFHPTWTSPMGLRANFAHWLVTHDRFAQVAGLREWISLFGGRQIAHARTDLEERKLLPGEEEGAAYRSANFHAAGCDDDPWLHNEYSLVDWGYESAIEKKFLFAMSALMRHVHFDLREFQRVLMNTKAYARVSISGDFLGQPRFSMPLAPLVKRLSAEQLWNSLVLLGGRDGPDWRFASELPQSLSESHALRVLGRGLRMHSDDSSRSVSFSLARFMINSDEVRHATEGKLSVVARTEAQWKNSPMNQVGPLFLAILGRTPSDRERSQALATVLQPDGLRQLAWSLLNTSEFMFEQ